VAAGWLRFQLLPAVHDINDNNPFWISADTNKQENHAIAKMTARCAQYMSALKIFESVE